MSFKSMSLYLSLNCASYCSSDINCCFLSLSLSSISLIYLSNLSLSCTCFSLTSNNSYCIPSFSLRTLSNSSLDTVLASSP
jgi:hypothetical protein